MKIDVVQEFMALAAINSPSRHELPVAEVLLRQLRELGLEPLVDDSAPRSGSDVGNILVRVPGNAPGPVVLLAAHMDTVGPTEGMTPVLRDGVIYSNGRTVLGADDKAGVAMLMALLAELQAGGIPHPALEIVFTVQEEVGLFGVSYMQEKLTAAFGYVLDGDGPVGHIVNQSPSKVDLDFTIAGKAAHAGVCPEAGINAIAVAARAIARLKIGRLDARTTANVGVIGGGKARNIVPDHAEAAIEVRSTDRERLEREVQAIVAAFEEEAAAAGASVTVKREVPFEAFRIAETHPVVINALQAASALGIASQLCVSGGGFDANVFNSRGLPCVALGIGIEDAHSPQEHIATAQLVQGVAFLKALLAEALYR
ncbi:MAG: M20/M25/M40 family metallo-hydrolase [Deltaproteobacteria bacterium]|nr:M20/M25/M40 family metallo-hydrolase [Deltaproteobacteria bacterium]